MSRKKKSTVCIDGFVLHPTKDGMQVGGFAQKKSSLLRHLYDVKIPEIAKAIGKSAISNCQCLRSIDIPDTVTTIGDNAFSGCKDLESIRIPASVTSIGREAFSDCDSLENIIIPETVASIGEDAFFRCNNLESIIVSPDNLHYETKHGVLISKDEKKLICYPHGKRGKSYRVPEGIKAIGNRAFFCSWLENIELPDSLTAIENKAFWFCRELKSIRMPDSVSEVGEYAFYKCESLTNIQFAASLKKISKACCEGCYKLSNVFLPPSVETIEEEAFFDCANLRSIMLPSSVIAINRSAFCKCRNLQRIVVPEKIKHIDGQTFCECHSLQEVSLPAGLKAIGYNSFEGCDKLSSVTLPDGLESIGFEAFYNCKNLQSLLLPDSIIEIGDLAFWGCDHLLLKTALNGSTPSSHATHTYVGRYIKNWQDQNQAVILHCQLCGRRNDRPIQTYNGYIVGAYSIRINWGEQKVEVGRTVTIEVYYPFFCNVGQCFSVTYGNNEFVTARLLSIEKMEKSSAVINAEITAKGNLLSFVKRLSADQINALKESNKYDYSPYEQHYVTDDVVKIDDHMFSFKASDYDRSWDCDGQDFIYTDDDGVDHLVGHFYQDWEDSIMYFGDRVIGLHEFCPYSAAEHQDFGNSPENDADDDEEDSGPKDYSDLENEIIIHRMPPWKIESKKHQRKH